MKKGFSKLLLAIVMTLQLVPSSMTTIVANDNIAYADDFVQITTENKPIAVYETGSGDIPEGVSKLNVAVHVDGAEKTSGVLTFGSATNPEKTEITANANYAVKQVTVNGEAFDNSIVYNREVGESEKNLVINVYTKATATIHYQDLEGNRLAADDVKEGKLHELLTIDAKAINGYTALKENASVMVLENTSNEITLVYSKAELSAPVDISFDLAGGAYNNSEEPVIVHAERGNRISETAIPTPVLKDKNFKGWKLDQDQKIYSGKDISAMAIHSKMNFKAVYENKTYTKKAEFFVLLPSSELPKNLAGNYNPKNFVPSNSNPWYGPNWAGNDIMHNQGTGFSGFISDEAYQKAYVNKKPITNENGVDSNYIYVPEGHIPLKYTVRDGVDKGKEIELTNIVWYSIKRQDNQKPHVDGYIKAVEVEIGYFANIDGFDTSVIEHAVTGNEYEVKDYSSLEGFPQRKGYIFTGWNTKADGSGTRYAAHAKFTVKTSVALYAQWKKTDQKYTIQHFDEDSNKKIHDDEYKDAKFGDIIEGSSCQLPIENFTFTKANTLTVDTDNKKNIIKVYYSKDENKDQIPDKYQIKVMYKAVNGTIDAVHENEPGNKMFYVTLYKNGEYATVEEGGIGHLSDDQIATATAARGYDQNSLKWSPKTPTTKLDLNEDTSFIAEFTKGSYDYSIEYYYDGVKGKTDTKKAVFEEVITLNPEVSVTYGGRPYTLDEVKNNPLTIDTDNKKNIIKVYYSKDENKDQIPDKYQIKVMYKAVNGTIDAVHENEPGNKMFYVTLYKNGEYATVEDGGIGHLSDEQIATATAARGYDQNSLKWSPKTPTTKLDLNEDTSFIAEFTKGSYDYSIEYYYDGVKGKTDTKKAAFEEVITLNPEVSVTYGGSPYALDKVKNNPLTIDTEAANNIIRVYYAKDTNGNGKPDYKEETYNVNFVAGENGKLEGTTLYKDYLSGTAINSAEGYKEPKAVADEGYAFDKWVIKDVEHKAGIETAEPGTYKVTGNTVVYAEFAKDTNGNGKPDYKEETYNVNFVAEANGTLAGTTLYSGILANTRIGNIAGFAMPVPTANLNYAFDKWIVRDVNHPEGIEINDPSTYIIHSNTVFYASFEEDQHGSDSTDPEQPDNVPDKYQAEVSFAAVNGTVSFNKTYVTLYDKQGNYAEDGTGRLAQNQIATATANSGYHFVNWTPQTPKQGMEITSEGAAFTAHYAINTYTAAVRFLNEDTGEELAPAITVNDIEHGTYLYGEAHRISIPGYVFTVADTKVVESEHVTVNVYYSADTRGGLPNPDTTPDGTPDKYQVRFAYVADTNGSVTGTTVEYVTRPGNNTTAAVRPQALVDAIANDGYSFMSWTANGNAYVNTDAMRNTYFTEDTVFTAGFAEVVAPILPTPVTPTPPAVTPQNPGTPIPAAPAAPQTPVNPMTPPIVVPVIPTPAPTPAPNPGPIVNEDDPDQPQGGESTEVQENPTPKGGGSQNEWALINLICAGGTVLLGLFLLLSKLKKEEEEEDEKTSAMRNDEEQSNGYKRRKWLRVASTITAVVSVIAFFLTEDITLPMVLVDKWTLLMAAFLIVQVIFVLFGRKWKELDDNKNNAETARS
ncbi:InlB B-repeat-containing protein [[Clostridium] innocuum]|nr:InlB B-repeat-containing protein [[Clostridium] innocuum]MCR0285878.1 InlB B-repeat-containing protein [[Clostridium] innocuum]MCR0387550.1 InlB B-repeat-containing protein [[Clostridium] innocuum]